MELINAPKPWYKKPLWWLVIVVGLLLLWFFAQVFIELHRLKISPAANNQLTPLTQPVPRTSTPAALVEPTNASLGPVTAPLQIVEFGDFSCPYCGEAFSIIRQFVAAHPDQIRFIYRHFPLDSVHPRARPAAIAAVCANEQGKFWPYHDKLFMNQGQQEDSDLTRYAGEIGLDIAVWQRCRGGTKAAAEVAADFQAGLSLGVDGTPTFFINGTRLAGVIPLAEWEQIFNYLVKS